ncbi:MAG: zinc ribbon domain-containing protein [Coriobacteriia bacterium]|nr:zinc ribbon domain-containing protein [Coriobacteriia bacterium]
MFCTGCGKEIPDVSKFCPYCGKEAYLATAAEASAAPVKAAKTAAKTTKAAATKASKAAAAEVASVGVAAEEAAASIKAKVEPVVEVSAEPAAKTAKAAKVAAVETAAAAAMPVAEPVVSVAASSVEGAAAPVSTPSVGAAPMGAAPQYAGQYPPQYAAQQASKKKSKKLPIIIAAVLALALVGGGVAYALNTFGNLSEKTALGALYFGTENLLFEASSATVEARAGVNATVKWDLGKDLKSSTFWGYSGGMGFLLKDDTLIVYEGSSSGGGIEVVSKESGIVGTLNDQLNSELDTKLDFNNVVSNGKLNRKFFEDLSAEVDKTAANMDTDVDSERMAEIVTDFMTNEINKKDVHDKVVLDATSSKSGSTTTHKGRLAPFSLLDELYNYAEQRGKDSRYQEAAKTITDALDSVRSMSSYMGSYLDDVSYEISVTDKFLSGLGVTLNTPSGAVSADISISDINATNLSNESLIQEILDAPEKSSNNYWDIFDFGSAF